MKTTQDLILEEVARRERLRFKVVERRLFIGPDGKRYGAGGLPLGIDRTKLATETYFAFQTRDGTTVGSRYNSRAEADTAFERGVQAHVEDMRKAMDAMTADEIQTQADYWLAPATT